MLCVIQDQLLDSIRKQYYIDGVFPDFDHGFTDSWRHTVLRRHMMKYLRVSYHKIYNSQMFRQKKIKCVCK